MAFDYVSHSEGAVDSLLLGNYPEGDRTRSLCLAMCGECGLNLKFVPQHLRDHEMCYLAVTEDFRAMCFVPIKLKIVPFFCAAS